MFGHSPKLINTEEDTAVAPAVESIRTDRTGHRGDVPLTMDG